MKRRFGAALALVITASLLAAPAQAQNANKESTPPGASPIPPRAPASSAGGSSAPPAAPAPGTSFAPKATGTSIAPTATGTSIAPARQGRDIQVVIPVVLTGNSEGRASASVAIGPSFPIGPLDKNIGWQLSLVAGAQIETSDGLATLVGLDDRGEVSDAPEGRFNLSATLALLDTDPRTRSTAYPPWVLHFGGDVGRRNFNYLTPNPDNRGRLVERDDPEVPWGVGMTTAWVPNLDGRFLPTIEGLFSFRSRWTGSTRTVQWCSPAGDVARDDVGNSDPAESCQQAALGAPINRQSIDVGIYGGVLDREATARWRAALGARFSIPMNDDSVEGFSLSIRAPVYVTFAQTPKESFQYRGVVRLMPSIKITQLRDGEKDIRALFELNLLGVRSLFFDRYDDTLL